MARPSSNIDQKLLQAGIEFIAQYGIRALTVRKVCEIAHANLGMFVYLFQNKDTYLKVLFDSIFDKLYQFLDMDKTIRLNELDRLKYFYSMAIDFTFQNKNLMRAVFVDVSMDKNIYENYTQKGIFKPFPLPLQLIKAAQTAGYIRTDLSDFKIRHLFFFGITVPILFSDCNALLRIGEPAPEFTRAEAKKILAILLKYVEIQK